MKNIDKILLFAAMMLLGQYAVAQPPARKKAETKKQEQTTSYQVPLSQRAKSQYPTNETPTEVVWKRDIYRLLDLEKEKNASLYYPVQPIGNSMNLFTYIFNHILDNSITAYEYNIDGYESFTPDNRVEPREMLENYGIYYEFGEDSTIIVNASDLPSNEVLSYYIKESYYFDQRTSTYNQRVTAICPVLHRAGEFTSEITKYPMFWLNYDEISSLLALQTVVSSSYNNVSSMTLDDYFTKHCYDGEIYKTVNLRNLAINQYCKDSTAVKKEQAKIEKQLNDFREGLWNTPQPTEVVDSATVASDTVAVDKSKKEKKSARAARKKSNKETKAKKSSSSSKSSGGAKVSVRRQRR